MDAGRQHPNAYCHAYGNAYQHADAYRHPHAYSHTDTNQHAHGDGHTAHGHTNAANHRDWRVYLRRSQHSDAHANGDSSRYNRNCDA
jgi:hypothetical protein